MPTARKKGITMIENVNSDIKEKIIEIMSGLFSDSGVDTDILEYVDLIDDLGMDSIAFITLIVEIETTFNISVPDELVLIENFKTFNSIYKLISSLILNKKETGEIQNVK